MIMRFLFPRQIPSTNISVAILILRVIFGIMIMTHGWGKLAGFSTMSANFMGGGAGLGLSVFAEFFCALGVVFGLFFRLALIPLIINMSVAFVAVHGAAISGNGSGEMALLYLAVFVSMLIAGPGQYAMDRMFVRRPGERD